MAKWAIVMMGYALLSVWGCQTSHKNGKNQVLTPQQAFLQQAIWAEEDSLFSRTLDSLQIDAWQVYLYCQNNKENDARKRRLISLICQRADNQINHLDTAYWGGILYKMNPFIDLIQKLKEPMHRSFLDVGSGNGEKLYAALCQGFEQSEGLEYDSALVSISEQYWQPMLRKQNMTIKLGNALTIDPTYYSQFDFIYMYSPIRNHVQMAKLYNTLMQQLKEGGVLLEVRMVYADQLREISQYKIPNLMGTFAVKKQGGKLYYVLYSQSTKDWILLEKKS